MACLDTSVLVNLLRGQEATVQRIKELDRTSEAITVTAPTLMELSVGAALAESREEQRQIQELLSSVTVLPLDAVSALRAGEIHAQLILQGETINPIDVQIGAIALSHGERLPTSNAKHFTRIPGLEVEDYTQS